MNPSILIADDHPLLLKGLNDYLVENNYNVLACAKNGKEALTLIKAHTPDIAILDIQMPFFSGLDIAETCKKDGIPTKIVLITFEKEESIYTKAKSLGVYAYILKEFALEEIDNCIAAVIQDKTYFSPELIAHIEHQQQPKYFDTLTEHEKHIVKLITQNKTGVEIAQLLSISPRTVEKHKSNIIKKLKLERKQNSLLIWAKDNSDYIDDLL